MNIVMVGPFGLRLKSTVRERTLPMAQTLSSRGHSVTLLVPSWDWPADSGRRWIEGGVRIESLPLPARVPVFFHLAIAFRLVLRTSALKPDVIHLFKPKGYTGLVHWILMALRRMGRSVPHLVLDTDDWEQAWNPVVGYPVWQRLVFTWQEQWGMRNADAITVASLALKELAQKLGVPLECIFYVPNGMRPAVATMLTNSSSSSSSYVIRGHEGMNVRLRYRLEQHPIVLLFTRFTEFRLSRLLELISRLAEQVPSARWLVVGKGFANEETILSNRLRARKLGHLVVFAGWVSARELPTYFAAADVAAFPFDDTPINQARCSVKLIDLMSAGLPVVTEAVGQNRCYIRDGETGLLVSPGDTAAFVAQLTHLLGDKAMRWRLGKAAQERMLQYFAWPELVGILCQAYQSTSGQLNPRSIAKR